MRALGFFVLFLAGCGGAPSQEYAAGGDIGVVSTRGADVNDYRRSAGLPALAQSSLLNSLAAQHARDMEQNGFFSHTGSDGKEVGDRARAAGYYYCRIAENIAQGQDSQAEVMTDWYQSQTHRDNILLRDVTEYGLARLGDDQWVMILAKPGCKNGRPARG